MWGGTYRNSVRSWGVPTQPEAAMVDRHRLYQRVYPFSRRQFQVVQRATRDPGPQRNANIDSDVDLRPWLRITANLHHRSLEDIESGQALRPDARKRHVAGAHTNPHRAAKREI